MRAREYPLIEEAIEEGVAYGYRRAFKYVDDPPVTDIEREIAQAVINAICERFDFDDS